MKNMKKTLPIVATALFMASMVSPVHADQIQNKSDTVQDKEVKAPSKTIVQSEANSRTSLVSSASYSLDSIISYPTANYNASTSLSFTNNTSSKLFVSNSPEMFNQQGILGYSTQINQTGQFRVYWAHKNNNTTTNYVGFALYNNTGKTIKVIMNKRSHVEGADGPQLGQKVLKDYLASSSADYTYATLNNGTYTYLGFPVARYSYGSGMYDIRITDTNGNTVTGGVTVKTYSTYDGAGNPSKALTDNIVLPTDGAQIRGLFPAAEKSLTWRPTGSEQISFGPSLAHVRNPSTANWPIPGNDIMSGTDESTGSTVYNYGNYGLIYNLTVQPQKNMSILLAPNLSTDQTTDKKPHYLAVDASTRGVLTTTINENEGWVVLNGTSGSSYTLKTSLPGYHWAPMRVATIN